MHGDGDATPEDRNQLVELLARYASIPDTDDWDELPALLFTDPILWDLESLDGEPAAEVPRTMLMEALHRFFAGCQATHHSITNHRVRVEGDVAYIRAHVRAEHWVRPELAKPGENCWLVVGFYDDEAVRTVDGWRLRRVRLTVSYRENDDVAELAFAEGERVLGHRDT